MSRNDKRRPMKQILLLLTLVHTANAQVVEIKSEVKDKVVQQVRLILNWVPEPEFGGFYAAEVGGLYEKHGLKVEIIPGGAGTPTVQMLGAGKVEFAITSASEIVMARAQKSDVVAVYSVFDTSPMGIMVHRSRQLKDLDGFFKAGGTLALQKGQAYVDFLQKKFSFEKVKIVPFTGGIAQFLKDPSFAQQGFIFSEPISAKNAGVEADFFLLANVGYNPYSVVLAVRGEMISKNETLVKSMVAAVREGWKLYLKDPAPANQRMSELNRAMNLETFAAGAEAQKPLLETSFSKEFGLGNMSDDRWHTHIQQLKEAKTISQDVPAPTCFKNFP